MILLANRRDRYETILPQAGRYLLHPFVGGHS
jgi:hypothetical protein